jgi:hypothetical protein
MFLENRDDLPLAEPRLPHLASFRPSGLETHGSRWPGSRGLRHPDVARDPGVFAIADGERSSFSSGALTDLRWRDLKDARS